MESCLEVMDYRACSEASTNITSNRPKNYRKWSEKECYGIGRYAAINRSRAAERKVHTKEKPLSESNAWRFSKLYKEEISKAQKNNRDVNRYLSVLPRGRPLLLGSLDQMVQRILLSISVAKALIARNPQYNLSHIDLDSLHWVQSLFRRMGFKKRIRTTGKVEIPEGARAEAELLNLHNIVTIVEKYEISHSLIMNLDQTPLKYTSAINQTMAKQNSKFVSVVGSSDKRSITGAFTITLNGRFLPMQLIYGGKPKQSLHRFKFPDGFSLSCNPKHFSNSMESIKLIKEIIIPYVQSQHKELGKPKQAALVIMVYFKAKLLMT